MCIHTHIRHTTHTPQGSGFCPCRLSQSALEGKFGYARSFTHGTGVLTVVTAIRAFAAMNFLTDDTVGIRYGQKQCLKPDDDGTSFSFAGTLSLGNKKRHTRKKRNKTALNAASPP